MQALRCLLLLVALISGTIDLIGAEIDLDEVAQAGFNLSATDAVFLETRLRTEPDNLDGRCRLLGYYFLKHSPARLAHVLWLIDHHPDDSLAGSPFAQCIKIVDGDSYAKGAEHWAKQLEAHPDNTKIIMNAAHYFILDDKKRSEELLKQGMILAPKDADFPEALSSLYSDSQPKDALLMIECALALSNSPENRYYMLSQAATCAYKANDMNKATDFATELLNQADRMNDWNTGNAINHGNTILGQIALRKGRIALACEYLIKSGTTKGSPQLDSFGPNMSLAKDLLDKGEKVAVLKYFNLCAEFWKNASLIKWQADVENGREPDFGANLLY